MIEFREAQVFKMPFGKYKGEALDTIAETDDGLRYLDWLVGQEPWPPTGPALEAYLSDPAIRADVEQLKGQS